MQASGLDTPTTSLSCATRYLVGGFFLTLLALVFFTFDHYGISSDEGLRNRYGKAVLSFYSSGFTDLSALRMGTASFYGGIFDTFAAAIVNLSPIDEYDTRRLIGGCLGVFGVFGVFRLATLLTVPGVGLLSAALLAMVPGYWGAMFFNPKDVPFAVFYIWSLYFAFAAARAFPRIHVAHVLGFGVAFGALLGVKIVGVIVALPLSILAASVFVYAGRAGASTVVKTAFKFFVPSCLVAYVVMLAFWPWAHQSPVLGPWKALVEFSDFSAWKKEVLVWGETYRWDQIPRTYLLSYLLVQLPELLLLGLFLASAFVARHLATPKRFVSREWLEIAAIVTAAALPPLIAILKGSTIYSGYRHFMFCIPPLCILGALALWGTWQRLRARSLRITVVAALLVYICFHVATMVRLHPYEYTYFNQAVGGLRAAGDDFETDYWAISYREAAARLAEHVATLKQSGDPRTRFTVAVCGPSLSAAYFLKPPFEVVRLSADPDFTIGYLRFPCLDLAGETIATVERDGVVLSVVRGRSSAETIPIPPTSAAS